MCVRELLPKFDFGVKLCILIQISGFVEALELFVLSLTILASNGEVCLVPWFADKNKRKHRSDFLKFKEEKVFHFL